MAEDNENCELLISTDENKILESTIDKPSKSRQRISSELLYSELISSSAIERVGKIFETKKEKPVMVSLGESPLVKKYSDLLKKFKETKDDFSPESDNKSPIIEIECFLNQNTDDDSESGDIENERVIFCGETNDSDEESSDESDSDVTSEKTKSKIEVINIENKQELPDESDNAYHLNGESSKRDDDVPKTGENSSEISDCVVNNRLTNHEPLTKKLRFV